jgi:hypothetical protein
MWQGDLIKEFVSADESFQDQVHIDRIHLGD